MANKKSALKSAPEKSILSKIAGQVGHLADEIVVGKDHLMEIAGDAIDSVKEKIHNITTKDKPAPKKPVVNKVVKAAIKKPVKKTITAVKKAAKPAVKKVASVKKSIKKVSGTK